MAPASFAIPEGVEGPHSKFNVPRSKIEVRSCARLMDSESRPVLLLSGFPPCAALWSRFHSHELGSASV